MTRTNVIKTIPHCNNVILADYRRPGLRTAWRISNAFSTWIFRPGNLRLSAMAYCKVCLFCLCAFFVSPNSFSFAYCHGSYWGPTGWVLPETQRRIGSFVYTPFHLFSYICNFPAAFPVHYCMPCTYIPTRSNQIGNLPEEYRICPLSACPRQTGTRTWPETLDFMERLSWQIWSLTTKSYAKWQNSGSVLSGLGLKIFMG